MEYYIFLVTVPNIEEGKKIAKSLVEKKIAACVNIINNIHSIYSWKGNIEEGSEELLIIKTTKTNADSVIREVLETHSYEVPECIAIKIDKGSSPYLNWIEKNVR